jgi:hypothetical protein
VARSSRYRAQYTSLDPRRPPPADPDTSPALLVVAEQPAQLLGRGRSHSSKRGRQVATHPDPGLPPLALLRLVGRTGRAQRTRRGRRRERHHDAGGVGPVELKGLAAAVARGVRRHRFDRRPGAGWAGLPPSPKQPVQEPHALPLFLSEVRHPSMTDDAEAMASVMAGITPTQYRPPTPPVYRSHVVGARTGKPSGGPWAALPREIQGIIRARGSPRRRRPRTRETLLRSVPRSRICGPRSRRQSNRPRPRPDRRPSGTCSPTLST